MAEDAKVRVDGGDYEDKTDERLLRSKNSNQATSYLTPNPKYAFTQLTQAFSKAMIFRHFDPKCHIQIGTDPLDYAIRVVVSQLT